MLAQLRVERKLSVADVAQRLKYGVRQIDALEAEEFDRLPGATFVRGMVRGYAKLLETDPEPILGSLDQRYVPGEISLDLRAKRVPFAPGSKRSGTRTYLLLSLVVLAVAGAVYEWRAGAFPWARLAMNTAPQQKQTKPRPAPAPASPAEAAAPVAPPVVEPQKPVPVVEAPGPVEQAKSPPPPVPQASGGEGRIRMEFAGESWVEVKDRDGQMLMSQLNPTGSKRVVAGRSPLTVVIGNAANVRLIYNEKPVDLKPYIQIEVARLTLN